MTTTGRTAVASLALEARGLTHQYESAARGGLLGLLGAPVERLRALDGVDLTVGAGEFVALVGPSGCGKTTLLRAAAGLFEPTSGTVQVLGGSSEAARASGALGLVSQDAGLLPWLTVEDNVRLTLQLTGARADVPALLERVGISRFARYYPSQLSGGMRQRVALARALAHGPAATADGRAVRSSRRAVEGGAAVGIAGDLGARSSVRAVCDPRGARSGAAG